MENDKLQDIIIEVPIAENDEDAKAKNVRQGELYSTPDGELRVRMLE
jgi:hypothetical protein